MDKREYGSYEEVHSMLVEAMQEACTKDESGNYLTPEADMSFLYEDVQPTRKKNTYFSNFNKVAAIIVIMLLGLNAAILITGSVESYSDGGLLHRIHEGARGIFTDEDPEQFVEVDETGKVWEFIDENQFDDAKKIWPDLYVPKYIPDGFKLSYMKITKNSKGLFNAKYSYMNDGIKLTLIVTSNGDEDKYLSHNKGELIRKEDRMINIFWNEIYDSYVVDIFFDDNYVCICGKLNKTELLRIAENIQ